MSPITTSKMSNFRWVICALLFIATTVNYMDRQVLSLTWKDFIAPEFHWTDDHYGTITGLFSIFYAIANLFAGKFVDWMGTKKGYLIAIFVWSTGAVMHAGCGWVAMQMEGYDSIEALRMVQAGSDAAVAIATISVWLFLSCRLILAVGEAGNFPAAIKVTAEYFPKKDRAFSTAIFNSGASVGALAAPATIPLLARSMGWEWAFIIIGVLGYVWMGLWVWLYDKPSNSKYVNKAELTYIEQDEDLEKVEAEKETETAAEEKTIGFLKCFSYRQTWSFIVGKLMTDGVWWFFLFWAPAYFSDQYGYSSDSGMGIALIFTLYAIVTVLSIGGGYLPTYFVDKKGMNPYIRQYRHPFREMLLEIPAGVIEEGESGEAAVLRELEEETGKRAGRAEFLCELYPSVGFCTEKIQLFFATELTAGTQKLDADEFVEIEKYTLEEAIAMIHKGEIKDGKTIAALFAWQARKNA